MSAHTWMRLSQLPERESRDSYLKAHVLRYFRGGGIKKNTSGEFRQMEDQDSENARIKAFINNEEEEIPMHLIIGEFCRPGDYF